MPRRIIIALLLLALAGNCWASSILETSGSARALSIGGKSIVNARNVADWLANPAGLSDIAKNQIGTSYANLFSEDIGFTFLGGTVSPNENLTLGAAYRQLKADVDYDLTYLESATTIGLGYAISPGISLGAAFNAIKVASDDWGRGYTLDLGVVKNISRGEIALGIDNLYSQLDYTTGLSTQLEPSYNFGIAYYPQKGTSLTLGIESLKYLSLGMEYALSESMTLRLGLNDRGFTGGAGLALGPWTLDYALFNNGLELEHRLATFFQL